MLSKRDRLHADELLARARCGEPTLERQAAAALAQWVAGDAKRAAYVRDMEAVSRLVDTAAPALRACYPQPDSQRASRVQVGLWPYVAGVCALCAMVLGVVWWLDPPLSRTPLTTAIGERRMATLADGSRLTLNTASQLE
jgi:ferric-dicitrate binding protein FerR (iron transport regulator)